MNDESKREAQVDPVRKAKGAAQETIGKLIGDDAEVRKGRTKQKGIDTDALSSESKEQE